MPKSLTAHHFQDRIGLRLDDPSYYKCTLASSLRGHPVCLAEFLHGTAVPEQDLSVPVILPHMLGTHADAPLSASADGGHDKAGSAEL